MFQIDERLGESAALQVARYEREYREYAYDAIVGQ